MAAIDKIYGTQEQYKQLKKWIIKYTSHITGLNLLEHLYEQKGYTNDQDRPISNFTTLQDMYLACNCPFEWVQDKLRYQYGDNYNLISVGKDPRLHHG